MFSEDEAVLFIKMISYDGPYLGIARMDSWRVRGRAVCGPFEKRKMKGGEGQFWALRIGCWVVNKADGPIE
jgi:hypothetical protein